MRTIRGYVGGGLLLCSIVILAGCKNDRTSSSTARKEGVWKQVGGGMDNVVNAFAVYKNELYAAGEFEIAGGTVARHIAKWNDTAWSSIAKGEIYRSLNTLAVYNGELYVGGNFDQVDSVHTNNIAK